MSDTTNQPLIFALHELLDRPYGSKSSNLLGVFQTFHAAHHAMVESVQSQMNVGNKNVNFLPSMRFQRVVTQPENRMRWEDTWNEYHTLPFYTITVIPINTITPVSSHKVTFYDPDMHIKNAVIEHKWTDSVAQTCLENIREHVFIPSGHDWERLYTKDIPLYDIEQIHAWIARKE